MEKESVVETSYVLHTALLISTFDIVRPIEDAAVRQGRVMIESGEVIYTKKRGYHTGVVILPCVAKYYDDRGGLITHFEGELSDWEINDLEWVYIYTYADEDYRVEERVREWVASRSLKCSVVSRKFAEVEEDLVRFIETGKLEEENT